MDDVRISVEDCPFADRNDAGEAGYDIASYLERCWGTTDILDLSYGCSSPSLRLIRRTHAVRAGGSPGLGDFVEIGSAQRAADTQHQG